MSKKLVLAIAQAILIISVGWGFFLVRSPSHNRQVKADFLRVEALRSLSYAVENYAEREKRLPESLDDLRDERHNRYLETKDPERKTEYSYRKVGTTTYELCAEFNLSSEESDLGTRSHPGPDEEDFWKHPAGKHCYEIKISENVLKK